MRLRALWLVFGLTIVLPGLLLTFIGLRALRQDLRSADRQIRERMDLIAEEAIAALDKTMRGWQEGLARWPTATPISEKDIPDSLRPILQFKGGGVLVIRGRAGLMAYPPAALAYLPSNEPTLQPPAAEPPGELTATETLEMRDRDFGGAIEAYKRLLVSLPQYRPRILMRLAGCFRKAGRRDEALNIYRELQKDISTILGGVPARLAASAEICSLLAESGPQALLASEALAAYRSLVGGGWALDKYQYAYYSEIFRGRLETIPASEELTRLRARETEKLALSESVDLMLRNPQRLIASPSGPALGFWRQEPFMVLIVAPEFFKFEVLPATLALSKSSDFDLDLTDASGGSLTGPGAPPLSVSLSVVRGLDGLGLPWRLRVQPRPGNSLTANLRLRQNLTLAVLVLMLAVLLFGGYLTLRTTRREVEVARLKSEFVSTVSHEFRSPLTGIRQLAGLLRDGRVKDDARRSEYYEMICRESDRLTRLVENLLDFSRIEEGRKDYRFERIATTAWLRGLVEGFESEAAFPGIALEAAIPDDLPDLRGDPEALAVAVHNLLDNAAKYSQDAKSIRLEADAAGGRILIRVRDRGIGISESEQPRVFDKFFRGESALAAGVKGAGLGLALVREITRAHGGAVALQSRPGEGSTFTLDLPIAPLAPATAEPQGGNGAP